MSSLSAVPAAPDAGRSRRTKTRLLILALLAVGTMINYLDRTVLGIAAPSMTADLGINAAVMGFVFSAFSWTYVIAQVPGGLFLDRFGSKLTYFLGSPSGRCSPCCRDLQSGSSRCCFSASACA